MNATSLMIEEIRQQPTALEETLVSGLRNAAQQRRRFERQPPRLVIIVARGTSDNAAQFGRYLIEIATGIPVSLAAPSIFTLYESPMRLENVLVVGISQSGESTDVNAVLEDAKRRGALTVGITNDARSKMAKTVDRVFLVRAGPEKSIAATKTYTSQLLSLYLLTYALGGAIRRHDLERVPEMAAEALRLEPEVMQCAGQFECMQHAISVGRGLNYATAQEFALKLMETCYVVAERFSAADLMHGPIALLEPSFPLFVFAPSGVTWPSIAAVLERAGQLKAKTLVITDCSNKAARAWQGNLPVLTLPAVPGNGIADLYTPIPYIVPAQLFSACLAAKKGLDPDVPRTLNKITRTM
jgi:glucosamine--fructose-6-phosphate aminotransferase (isomerizing)